MGINFVNLAEGHGLALLAAEKQLFKAMPSISLSDSRSSTRAFSMQVPCLLRREKPVGDGEMCGRGLALLKLLLVLLSKK